MVTGWPPGTSAKLPQDVLHAYYVSSLRVVGAQAFNGTKGLFDTVSNREVQCTKSVGLVAMVRKMKKESGKDKIYLNQVVSRAFNGGE